MDYNKANDVMRSARAKLSGLIVECPGGGNPVHCQLCEVRKTMDLRERYAWTKQLSDEEIIEICEKHDECARRQKLFEERAIADRYETL